MARKQQSVNVKFADTYVGCSTLGNIMGLHEETVRKRAKSGKIPGQLIGGKWTFRHVELVLRGIQPFASNPIGGTLPNLCGTPPSAPVPQIARVNETDVIFVLDRSGSMGGLMHQARKNLEDQIEALRRAASPNDVYRISVIAFDDSSRRTLVGQDVTSLGVVDTHRLYPNTGGNTAMNDAIAEAIKLATDGNDRGQAFLISVVTDGGENASRHIDIHTLAIQISSKISTGRFTFAYAGPRGSEGYARSVGIPTGNVTTWEQTVFGTQDLGRRSVASMDSYTTSRSAGVLNSTSFYAQPVVSNPQDFANQLGKQLTKLDAAAFKVERVMPADPIVIRTFCEAKLGGFQKGKIHYQLTESEKVQDYKSIVIQDTATGNFYAGWDAAAKLLGIPKFSGTVRIRPGKLGEFKVFIQSTSVNRKLQPGTAVVCLT